MEGSSRDRSPLRHPAAANIGFMPSFVPTDDTTALHSNLAQDSTNTYSDPSFATTIDQNQYFGESSFDVYSQPVQQPAGLGLDDIASLTYNAAIPDHLSPHSLSNHTSPAPEGFPNLEYTDTLDSTLVNELDLLQQPGLNYTNNPLDSMSATMNTHNPTPPHLLPQMGRKSSSPSPRATPSQSPFLQRQRNTSESLDPSSAQYLSQNVDWAHVQGHRGHRRMHSDNLSDISSHSAQASPYLPTMDSFDQNHASPMLNPQDPAFSDGLGIGQFTIGDNRSYSPAVSPHISPRLGAQQQPLPQFTSADGFGLNAPLGGTYAQPNGLDAFAQEAFPSLSRGASPGETGMEHMSPPEFKIDLAPPIKPFETSRPSLGDDTLGLPSPRGNRARAKSDSSARPMTPSFQGRGRSPSQPGNSLSPYPAVSNPSSREPSPARGRNGSLSGRYRSTSATSDQREYILDLADPQRSPSTGDNKRQQKHPATFQCHLCPKRFTRAYNLRSHLRTHTDERPFVCTVCDKAFARQHDRKRHESLHSGEKKFVCRGQLKNGGSWGCSRRFARADALGRHFRSEAGRVCIKPLLEEEAVERRQALWQEQQAQVAAGYPVVEPQLPFFPAAILQQYPALAGFDWNQPQTNIPEEEYAGRSSFDASSGGEMYDEVSENEMGIGSMSVNGGYGLQPQHQMNSYSGHQMGDFTNGFEGR